MEKHLTYTMPPEWEKHERTLISWPVKDSMVYPEDWEAVCKGYAELILAIAEFEPITVLVNAKDRDTAAVYVEKDENVTLLEVSHNDAWLRDNGPTFVRDEAGKLAGVNWRFNAWGEKYFPWDLDDAVAPAVLDHFGVKQLDAPIVLEGGSIHVDGEGTLITTEECLLNPNRNSDLSKEDIEAYLRQYLGIEKVIWLKRGVAGDETDGHVDNIACFAAPGKLLLQVTDDPEDENYEITQENLRILDETKDARGRQIEVIAVQQPPKATWNDTRLTLSYINFYFVNGGIILPVFGNTAGGTDERAIKLLQEQYPDRRIRTIDGLAIIKEGGNVHCTTQQMPAVKE
ncbi:agmatine deiminase [Terribacillus saccharophilus]|uniref:agmatine deiminase family protein n=1 Tax=Terribacillus saccharophilus TaxID=361277 RepID=UPI000BA769C0|nr:agmatine deiminase family protein [Terribacillus saccharophilus]PAF18724.1 agmatine deiminase [Terribacillus saccharophilus]PAF23285.1 agmatine deiminase [Terribacillus saccharophilus]PAF35296.1 agmatine deiminase [Terribacillus saccharophilus]PAF36969.1 agmatine deiminase [Terribacillus saccharophilus]